MRRVIVVDWRDALSQSRIGRALVALEAEERRAARDQLDALKAELEAQESALAAARDGLEDDAQARAQFDARVRAFDQRVRRARRSAQEISSSMQQRFTAARAALEDQARPVLEELMRERGADIALDADRALLWTPEVDATQALIGLLDAVFSDRSAADLLPARPQGGAGVDGP